jgi:Leucine-rich repeat (LRR) protein
MKQNQNTQSDSNIENHSSTVRVGLNMDSSINQISPGQYTYALNSSIENFDSNSFSLQNEEGNELCLVFPKEMVLIGRHFIGEKNKHIFFLVNPDTNSSEIGYMDNNDCLYHTLINASCLNFDTTHPIRKVVHKINNCATEIYWTDGFNPRRYLNIDDIPKLLKYGSDLCDPAYSDELDCNQLLIQPNFSTPTLSITDVISGGNLIAGTYQFAIQYSDALGNPYTSYQSITNPTPIADLHITTVNFNYPVGKSITLSIGNLDSTGQFQYFNLAVLKTINAITTVELVGTYYIDNTNIHITYTGQNVESIQLAIEDIFEKFPYYDVAQDLTATQEILVWDNLTSIDRVNYQSIASKIVLQWETWRIPPTESYANEVNATNLRSYLRDEVYAFEICFLLKNGKQTDSFHIPGRIKNNNENESDIADTNLDFIGNPDYVSGGVGYSPYWKIYNTASVIGNSVGYSSNPAYKGPWQYGDFAYWESTEEYPCNETLWGELAGQKIRHHKFPDVLVSPIYESKMFVDKGSMVMGNDAVFPIGVHIDPSQISACITNSTLTREQQNEIIGYKILRGDRGTNKSIIAKGLLRNIGKYTREEEEFYYPNYPYNDLAADPFLTVTNNAFTELCDSWTITVTTLVANLNGVDYADIALTSCDTNKQYVERVYEIRSYDYCSTSKPILEAPAEGTVNLSTYENWNVWNTDPFNAVHFSYIDYILGYKQVTLCPSTSVKCDHYVSIKVELGSGGPVEIGSSGKYNAAFRGITTPSDSGCKIPPAALAIDSTLADRQIFNSPETSFGQPFLGDILKIENTIYGSGKAHFTQVKDNAKYRLLSEAAQIKALDTSNALGAITTNFDSVAMFTAYQAYLAIYINGITRKNYAYSFNSIADYNYSVDVPNNQGIKQRTLDIARYLIPGVQSVGDDLPINNYQRETSVFLKTNTTLPFPTAPVEDYSRFTISDVGNCATPAKQAPIQTVSYYASLKNNIVNQWGQIYSYETIDTGFERIIDVTTSSNTVFGGDTFISRFAFKTKLPFFIDNRVNAPDDSDIFYDEIGNIAYPKYWHSSRSILKDYMSDGGLLSNIISYKAHNFDCPNDGIYTSSIGTTTSTTTSTSTTLAPGTIGDSTTAMYYDGYFYLFAYGVPNFYCETSYNTDLRQAFNNREGEFWPHVTTDIPDDWVQESFVPIAQDNTYYYNTTFSKQNKENTFSHLPVDWDKPCYTYYPFRAIYSDVQTSDAQNRVNAWLTYRALSYFDFPQNYGSLTSLDGIQNRAILARFENKSLLYNNLLIIDTSNPQAAYVGNPKLFEGTPPIDFAETDLGYVGSQHKMLLKIPQGQVTVDAKRGQVFLINGQEAIDLSAFGSGMNRFFTDHLAFEILRYYPDIDVDNNYTGVGLHGVYDSKYDRVILTKLDYIPLPEYAESLKFDSVTHQFYIEEEVNTDSTTSTTTSTSSSTSSSTTTITTTTLSCGYGPLYNAYTIQGTEDNSITSDNNWVVPSQINFNNLISNTGGPISGGNLKETGFVHWNSPNTGATNIFGFTGTGNGLRQETTGEFELINEITVYWTSDVLDLSGELQWDYGLIFDDAQFGLGASQWNRGFSIRLCNPSTALAEGQHSTYIQNDGTILSTLVIGGVEWLLEDLRDRQYRDHTIIPEVTDNNIWINLTTGAICAYNNNWNTVICSSTTTTTTTTTSTELLSFTLSTESTDSMWQSYINNIGDTLHWEVTGAVVTSADDDNPIFDFSTPGTKNIVITSTDNLIGVLEIYMYNKDIISISVSSLVNIMLLNVSDNNISILDIASLTQLTELYCPNNSITDLDVSNLSNLIYLECQNNNISILDVSTLLNLEELIVYNNTISVLDVSNLLELTQLRCSDNSISVLDVSLLTNLMILTVNNNLLSILDVANLINLTELECNVNNISVLNVSLLTNLIILHCSDNVLSVLDITSLVNLTDITAENNSISVLDVASLINLTTLYCSNNNISVLDITASTGIIYLSCYLNNISVLDITSLTVVRQISCFDNNISTLTVTTLNDLTDINIQTNNIPVGVMNNILSDLVAIANPLGNGFDGRDQNPAIVPDSGIVADLAAIWTTVSV